MSLMTIGKAVSAIGSVSPHMVMTYIRLGLLERRDDGLVVDADKFESLMDDFCGTHEGWPNEPLGWDDRRGERLVVEDIPPLRQRHSRRMLQYINGQRDYCAVMGSCSGGCADSKLTIRNGITVCSQTRRPCQRIALADVVAVLSVLNNHKVAL